MEKMLSLIISLQFSIGSFFSLARNKDMHKSMDEFEKPIQELAAIDHFTNVILSYYR